MQYNKQTLNINNKLNGNTDRLCKKVNRKLNQDAKIFVHNAQTVKNNVLVQLIPNATIW